jgi:hypothetical protein
VGQFIALAGAETPQQMIVAVSTQWNLFTRASFCGLCVTR